MLLAQRTCTKRNSQTNKQTNKQKNQLQAINQSINQSTNQSINQSINQTNQKQTKQKNKTKQTNQHTSQQAKETTSSQNSKQQRKQAIKQVSKQTNRKGQFVALSRIWEIRNEENEKKKLDNIQTHPDQHCHKIKTTHCASVGSWNMVARVDHIYTHDDNIGDKKEWRNVIERFL